MGVRKYATEEERKAAKREQHRRWREANREKERERGRRYHQDNKEERKERQRQWYQANREEKIRKETERQRRLREANPEEARKRGRESQQRYREANPEKSAKYIRSWREANPGKRLEYTQRRRALKRSQHGLLPVTAEVINQRFELFGHACAYCGAQHDLQVDHFIPLSQGGTHAPSNLVPACPSCNLSKHDGDPEQWYRQQPSFNEQRWKQIQKATGHDEAPGQLGLI